MTCPGCNLHRILSCVLVLLALSVVVTAASQIPVPSPQLLLTPDEVKSATVSGAPCFPLSVDDANWRPAARHLLPATVTVEYVRDDRTATRVAPLDRLAWRVPHAIGEAPPCSQRVRDLVIREVGAPPERVTLLSDVLSMVVTRFADPAHAAAALEERRRRDRGQPGESLSTGDGAWMRGVGADRFADARDVYLVAQKGAYHIVLAMDAKSPYYEQKLRRVVRRLAAMIVAKIEAHGSGPATVTPAVIDILEGPSGIPNPVAPGGTVQCSVRARHGQGRALSYQWTADCGSFSDPNAAAPSWTAPAGATEGRITLHVSAADGARVGASYLQRIQGSQPAESADCRVLIDGRTLATEATPRTIDGRLLVGLADVFTALGADLTWDAAKKQITATRGARTVQLAVGESTALVDGVETALDAPPMILGGTMYVPVRFVSQALGASVSYDAQDRTVEITTAQMPPATGTPAPPLSVTSPLDGETVAEQFTISGTAPPGRAVWVSAIAEATLKATGQTATSPVVEDARVVAAADGHWRIAVDARAVCRDDRVKMRRIKVSAETRANGAVAEAVELSVRP